MRITDVKCAVIGDNVVVRILTDEGISGYGEGEYFKPFVKPAVMQLRESILGEDPTDVERTMQRIRRRGGFKPHGTAVSMIEMALWDVAGKAAGLPVYKLLGGKVRDRVRVYNGAIREPMKAMTPDAYAEEARKMKALPHGFSFVKMGVAFHSPMRGEPGFHMGEAVRPNPLHGFHESGLITAKGMGLLLDCVAAAKDALGDEVGLALDCGPGFTVPDALRFARAVEHHDLMWLEDMITGDYTPFVNADVYHDVTHATTTPIHTRQSRSTCARTSSTLIEGHAVNVIGPDPWT